MAQDQAYLFLVFSLTGVAIGILFDFFRILRRSIKTLDIITYNIIGNEFENTKEFKWLEKNAHKYGFILRYPKDKTYLTGYSYES